MRQTQRLELEDAVPSRSVLLRRESADAAPTVGRDWYETCLARITELEKHAAHHGELNAAVAPWCELCAAIGDGLDHTCNASAQGDIDYLNAGPIAKWSLRVSGRTY